jgi:hypothetical protein
MSFGNCVAFCYTKWLIAILASQKVLHFAEHFAKQNVRKMQTRGHFAYILRQAKMVTPMNIFIKLK